MRLIAISGAALTLVSATRVAASELVLGGQVTAAARTVESEVYRDSQQFTLTTTLDGAGYYWRPWFITGNFKLNLSRSQTELEHNEFSDRQESTIDFASGEARLNAFPQSRFPLQTFVEVFDTRVESDAVGVALDDINTLRRERIGATQQYRPADGTSNYSFQFVRTHLLENNLDQENIKDVWAAASHQFSKQSLSYRFNVRETERNEQSLRRDENHSAFTARHEVNSRDGLTVESALDVVQDEERTRTRFTADGLFADDVLGASEQSGTASSFLTWRPTNSPWTMRANVGAQARERRDNELESYSDARNVAAGATYDITTALHLSGDVGVTRTRSDVAPEIERRFQDLALDYSPAAIPLGPVAYSWSARGSVGNTDASNEKSVQSSSAGLQHGLSRVTADDEGQSASLSVDQSAVNAQDSRGTDLLTLSHLGSAAVLWSRPNSATRLQLALNDSRTTGVEHSADTSREIDLTVQTANATGSRQWQANRFNAFETDLAFGAARVFDGQSESRSSFASAGAGYTYRQAFRIDQLRFRSRLDYSVRESSVGAVALEDEERASWDNRFDYTVGLLNLALRRTITLYNGNRTTVTVLSASRTF